ncbi:MAG: SsrA-binding protein [Candidatus Deianiraeaceae bacterium]|jgi:SsrA-binding protein
MSNLYIKNKKAWFNYKIFETFEAGVVLKGAEVKAIRLGKIDISEAYIYITKKMEAEILNCTIQNYSHATLETEKYETRRPKKLLLHRREIEKIAGKIKTGGFTAVPLSIYINKRQKVKMEIALAKGKKNYDKRQSLKEKDMKRQEKQVQKNISQILIN